MYQSATSANDAVYTLSRARAHTHTTKHARRHVTRACERAVPSAFDGGDGRRIIFTALNAGQRFALTPATTTALLTMSRIFARRDACRFVWCN